MNSPLLQLLVLAGIAVFLILRLRSVLGTRDGFEGPPRSQQKAGNERRPDFEVIEGGPDRDITDYVEEGSETAETLARMKRVEPSFGVAEFLQGARGAYELILMGFERGNLEEIKPYLAEDVYEAFAEVVHQREENGYTIEADFAGVRETSLVAAEFDEDTGRASITVRFIGELTSVVYDKDGNVVEGKHGQIKRQKDRWTFERFMGSDDPNWLLVATGE
ncbi:Tim44/TimA family putative adaptor protein [Roseovarius salinarum]|uniref:Tim44/TimA family putative adaptor protein n=1 Tax=Roseovarius salinarum TaxID=1981892 RepID=UPI000C327F81|nr:Tim44/TimA family putative adaptor protein [Roseovarius salinarum]